MFDELLGLPAHPLMVHAPVVLVPIAALIAVAYAFLPPLRHKLGWLLVLSSLAAVGTAFAAVQSGKVLAAKSPNNPTVNAHGALGEMVLNVAAVLAVIAVVLVVVDTSRRKRQWDDEDYDDDYGYGRGRPRSGGFMLGAVSLVLTVALLGAAAGAGFFVARTGHSGAQMVWGQR